MAFQFAHKHMSFSCSKVLDTLEDSPILEDLPIIKDPSWKSNAKDILEDPSYSWFFTFLLCTYLLHCTIKIPFFVKYSFISRIQAVFVNYTIEEK
jgi:hypothetical protein